MNDYNLKNLNNWLKANKICLNVSKVEVVFFISITKQTDSDLHPKLNGKQIYPTESLKYFGIITDKNLTWYHQINNLAGKLNRARGGPRDF